MTRDYLKRWYLATGLAAAVAFGTSVSGFGQQRAREPVPTAGANRAAKENADRLLAEGMQTFRYDTFGSEEFWGGTAQAARGHRRARSSVASGPASARSRRSSSASRSTSRRVPEVARRRDQGGQGRPRRPANTLALLKANAVVGVTGFFDRGWQAA